MRPAATLRPLRGPKTPQPTGGAPRSVGRFLWANAPWLGAGFLLALSSSFGQTFFIGVFADAFKAEFSLSHGAFGALYMIATLASAAALLVLGPLADQMPARRLAFYVVLAFAAVCVLMASVTAAWMLALAIFGLRLCGQGMMSHLSQTCMARWFAANRGRALAIAAFGYPVGEAILPRVATPLIDTVGWRGAWLIAAAALLTLVLPLLWRLLRDERAPRTPAGLSDSDAGSEMAGGMDGRHWTRRQALGDSVFWRLLPGVMAPSFILTVVFFLPGHIADVKSAAFTGSSLVPGPFAGGERWSLADVVASYALYAVFSVAAAFAAGAAIDRFSARALLPFYLLPLAVGLCLLSMAESLSMLDAAMIAFGVSAGASATLHAALWAELYGTRHIGGVKSLAHAAMVLSTAAGPGVVGLLIDAGVGFERQALAVALYVALVSVFFASLSWSLRRRL